MDWNKIEEEYPRAFEWFLKWCDDQRGWNWNGVFFGLSNTRDLYDFFDAHRLHVNLHVEEYKTGDNFCWGVTWLDGGTMFYGDNGEYPTRAKAEQAAFEKAFEILEGRLK